MLHIWLAPEVILALYGLDGKFRRSSLGID